MVNLNYIFKNINSRLAYTRDIQTIYTGSGIYEAYEWNLSRKTKHDFYTTPTYINYLKMILKDSTKISSTLEICKNFNFSKYNIICDIGGVPFIQAWVIGQLNPNLKFILTDYDSDSVKQHSLCPPLPGIECSFLTLNVITSDFSKFQDCDLVTMWGVDYALDDNTLIRLFNYLNQNNISMLMATFNTEHGMIRNIWNRIRGELEIIKNKARMHGILRNEKYIKKLCEISDVRLNIIYVNNEYRIFKIN